MQSVDSTKQAKPHSCLVRCRKKKQKALTMLDVHVYQFGASPTLALRV